MKTTFFRNFAVMLLALGLSLSWGCSSEPTPKRGTFRKNPEVFKKLKDYSLTLSLLTTRRDFYAGEEHVMLTFSLKNTGLRPVTLFEWHTLEAANIHLYYRPGTADAKAAPNTWKLSPTYDPKAKNLENRSPLTLNPGSNQALVQIPAAFLKTLNNPSGQKQTYTLRAVLNLKSVTVQSLPTEIYLK